MQQGAQQQPFWPDPLQSSQQSYVWPARFQQLQIRNSAVGCKVAVALVKPMLCHSLKV